MDQLDIWDSTDRNPPRPSVKRDALKAVKRIRALSLAFETKLHSHIAEIRDAFDAGRDPEEREVVFRQVIDELSGVSRRFSSLLLDIEESYGKAVRS